MQSTATFSKATWRPCRHSDPTVRLTRSRSARTNPVRQFPVSGIQEGKFFLTFCLNCSFLKIELDLQFHPLESSQCKLSKSKNVSSGKHSDQILQFFLQTCSSVRSCHCPGSWRRRYLRQRLGLGRRRRQWWREQQQQHFQLGDSHGAERGNLPRNLRWVRACHGYSFLEMCKLNEWVFVVGHHAGLGILRQPDRLNAEQSWQHAGYTSPSTQHQISQHTGLVQCSARTNHCYDAHGADGWNQGEQQTAKVWNSNEPGLKKAEADSRSTRNSSLAFFSTYHLHSASKKIII